MQRIAVVTGANKGIGYEIAKQLLTTCTVVVLACRNKELGEAAVKQLASPKARFMQCDISDSRPRSRRSPIRSLRKSAPSTCWSTTPRSLSKARTRRRSRVRRARRCGRIIKARSR